VKPVSTVNVIARLQIDRKPIKAHLHSPMGWRQGKGVYHLIDHLSPDTHGHKQGGDDKPGPTQ